MNNLTTNLFIIRRALGYVCMGYPYDTVVRLIAEQHRTVVTLNSVCEWVKQFNPPYLEIRHLNKGYDPVVKSYLEAIRKGFRMAISRVS